MEFMESTSEPIEFKDGHYEIGMPFCDENIKLPNNRECVLKRLKGLERKFKGNSKFTGDYIQFMQKIIDKGYAEILPDSDMDRQDGKI